MTADQAQEILFKLKGVRIVRDLIKAHAKTSWGKNELLEFIDMIESDLFRKAGREDEK
jgi:hypothetical protein